MKRLLLALALTSCAHHEQSIDAPATIPWEVKPDKPSEIKQLQEDVQQLRYFIDHEKCFISYAVCLGENKKADKLCWDNHEACVIRVYHQYKDHK